MATRRKTLEDELSGQRAALDAARTDAERDVVLRAGLSSTRGLVVAQAAQAIKARALTHLNAELEAAYRRLAAGDPAKADPGCKGKHAVLEALDFSESMDDAVFLEAVRYVQLEPVWGGTTDTAVQVRARALLALARIASPDLPLLAAEALADPFAGVRAAAADALAGSGSRVAAAPLFLKLATPDEDPMVTLACMSALVSLAPDHGQRKLVPLLASGEPELKELAAIALAQSGRAEAVDAVIDALAATVRAPERAALYRALGLGRSEKAAALLLERVAAGKTPDAEAALRALAPRRFEPGMAARIEAAVRGRAEADLAEVLVEVLAD